MEKVFCYYQYVGVSFFARAKLKLIKHLQCAFLLFILHKVAKLQFILAYPQSVKISVYKCFLIKGAFPLAVHLTNKYFF